MPQLAVFYQTVAQLCFTLLGLWWLVLQTKYAEWIGDRDRRRMATNISLYFLLPGAMSLLALLSTGASFVWQAAFVVASGLGALETLLLLLRDARTLVKTVALRAVALLVARAVGVLLYLVVFIVALFPGTAHSLNVAPLLIAGTSLTLLVVLGVGLAWAYFMEPQTVKRAA
ncbi:MAG: hypothetical protein ABI068_04670 [Ktedonobacterales bacterium]